MHDLAKFRGVFPPLVTPLSHDESLDLEGLKAVVDFLLAAGVNGLFVLGSSGEFPYLATDERLRVAEVVADEVGGRVPLVLCVSAHSVSEAKRLVDRGRELGVEAFAAVLPTYFELDPPAVRRFYRDLSGHCEQTPLFAYYFHEIVPASADLPPKLVAGLANEGVLSGLKASTFGWDEYAKPLLDLLKGREDFVLFAGSEGLLLKSARANQLADGLITSPSNHFPRFYVEWFDALRSGDQQFVESTADLVDLVVDAYVSAGVLQAPALMKTALAQLGLPVTTRVRSPLPPLKRLHAKKLSALLAAFEERGFLDRWE
ncbi:MAG: dihydrodipicolinate synthase family protein [Promethearchaeota archaeon]